ncbi:MAG: class I tRNA ligase family protein, partial [Bryobacteraceae bacterium]
GIFCDWYVEIKKLRFREDSGLDADWRNVLTVFETGLRLLHPAMPFITEELWQRLAAGQSERPLSIALAPYPDHDPAATDEEAERQMELVQQIIGAARNLRATLQLDPRQTLEAVLYSKGLAAELAQRHREIVERLAGISLDIQSEGAPAPGPTLHSTPEFDLLLRISAAQSDVHRRRLEKEIQRLESLVASSQRQLSNEEFLRRAPAEVIASLREKLAGYEDQLARHREVLAALSQ